MNASYLDKYTNLLLKSYNKTSSSIVIVWPIRKQIHLKQSPSNEQYE